MKTTRDYLNIIDAYHELGSYRAAALQCGTTDKTVRRVVERHQAGGPWTRRPRLPLPRNTDPVLSVLAQKVKDTDGRISAKRLLPVARAAGYTGSARNLRRAVAKIKTEHRQKRRLYRPWVPTPGQHLVIDWTPEAGLHCLPHRLQSSPVAPRRLPGQHPVQGGLGKQISTGEEAEALQLQLLAILASGSRLADLDPAPAQGQLAILLTVAIGGPFRVADYTYPPG